MIQIGKKIISRELFEKHFICQLEACRGKCCIIGDSGAPLEDGEAALIADHLTRIKAFMRNEGVKEVSQQGGWVIDGDGDRVTPLIGREECAFVVFEGNIARCAIENAYREGAIPFRKPLSCHLYPIRISKLKQGIALNYHQWEICGAARIMGEKRGIPVFRCLEDALIRAFGEAFYHEMEAVYLEINNNQTDKTDESDTGIY